MVQHLLIFIYYIDRLSNDLDFFAVDPSQNIRLTEIEGILNQNNFNVDYVTKIYDRCIYYIIEDDEQIKIEFAPLYFTKLKGVQHKKVGEFISSL